MNNIILPAEWAEQSMVQLTWPHEDTDWNYCLEEITATYVEMAAAISSHEPLLIVTPHPGEVKALLSIALSERQMNNITLHKCPTNDTWARDHGFITLKRLCSIENSELGIENSELRIDNYDMPCEKDNNKSNHNSQSSILNSQLNKSNHNSQSSTLNSQFEVSVFADFRFNGWGEKFPAGLDNAINRSLYDRGLINGIYADNNDFVLEGGSIESDGKGTIFTTTGCLMAPNRNQPMTREDIDRELKNRLGAKRIVWIDYGHLDGDDTDGHIDTLVRVAPNDTLLYIGCDDKNDSHYEDLHLMEEQLKTLRTDDGRPYRLIRLPMADAIYEDGERLPATYANFLVINDAVLVPVYAQPENDSRAVEAIRKAFPGREMICIDSRTIIRQHGSIHCCTMQFPK